MSGQAHSIITRVSLDRLDAWEQELWLPYKDGLIKEFCLYPDRYNDPVISPYLLFLNGKLFHYFPVNQDVVENRHDNLEIDTEDKWKFIAQGFEYYIGKISEKLKGKNCEDAAKFAGVFIHVLQDQCAPLHCLEGPEGTNLFILDELLSPPEQTRFRSANVIQGEPDNVSVDLGEYQPLLLGTSIPEVVFNLYQRYREVNSFSRFQAIPLVLKAFAGDQDASDHYRSKMAAATAQLVADVLHTVSCLAFSRFNEVQVKNLEEIDLSKIKPVKYPRHLCMPYRFTPIIPNYCLNQQREPVPLKLKIKDGAEIKETVFPKGMGTGCHVEYRIVYEIPSGIYDYFKCAVGLHSELGMGGKIQVEIKFCNKSVFNKVYNDDFQASYIETSVLSGGKLELVVKDKTGNWANPKNNIVWGNPVLLRNPNAPKGIG